MYDKLVKSLRICARAERDYECVGCAYRNKGFDCNSIIKNEAADAIEERCQQVDKFAEEAARLYAKQPKWIPVTERLPEKKKAHYLCLLDDDSMAVVYWSKIPDWASKGEWAWHNPNWKEVTHWMPLPQPPKAEEGE